MFVLEIDKMDDVVTMGSSTPVDPLILLESAPSNPITDFDQMDLQLAICVQGEEFNLPDFALLQLRESAVLAQTYVVILCGTTARYRNKSGRELSSHLSELMVSFSRSAAEAAALKDAANYEIPTDLLDEDVTKLAELGSFDDLIDYHNNKQKESGLNVDRIDANLKSDPNYLKIRELVDNGVVIDTAADFVPIHRTAKFRNLQVRLLPVYRKAVAGMHAQNKVLLFRIADIPSDIYASMHTANEYHWRPEPGKIAGRPLLDCSNCAPGEIPLNSEGTKELGIQRYQRVVLPNLRQILLAWDNYRFEHNLQWSDMWIFKADIAGCFNQLHWAKSAVRLMGFVLEVGILMIMLTCGFGHGVTPMVWSLLGDAMNIKVNDGGPCPVFTFVDDFLGGGSYQDALTSQELTHIVIRDVMGYEGLSVKKNVFSQTAEILGILVNCVDGTLRPKDKALDKLFFVLFSIDIQKPQSLQYWQCLSSLVNLYSPFIRGMRPFVAAINHMTRKATIVHKARAQPYAAFAIAIWRAAMVVSMLDPDALSVPIVTYVRNPKEKCVHVVIADASPWRLCAAIYHPQTSVLLAWATFRLPYAKDFEGRSQGHREYLGYLFSVLLILRYVKQCGTSKICFQYKWINDNKGALQWADKDKCSSLASQFACMAVSQIHMFSNIYREDTDHLPGVEMGEIDLMSRMEDGETLTSERIRRACPSLLPSQMLDMDTPPMNALFAVCDPSIQLVHQTDHHAAFVKIYALVQELIL